MDPICPVEEPIGRAAEQSDQFTDRVGSLTNRSVGFTDQVGSCTDAKGRVVRRRGHCIDANGTLEDHRGNGYAGLSVAHLIHHMRALGKAPVWQAVEENPASLRLAAKLGFEPIDEMVLFERR